MVTRKKKGGRPRNPKKVTEKKGTKRGPANHWLQDGIEECIVAAFATGCPKDSKGCITGKTWHELHRKVPEMSVRSAMALAIRWKRVISQRNNLGVLVERGKVLLAKFESMDKGPIDGRNFMVPGYPGDANGDSRHSNYLGSGLIYRLSLVANGVKGVYTGMTMGKLVQSEFGADNQQLEKLMKERLVEHTKDATSTNERRHYQFVTKHAPSMCYWNKYNGISHPYTSVEIGKVKLTKSNVEAFIQDYEDGMSVRELRERYQCSMGSVIVNIALVKACKTRYISNIGAAYLSTTEPVSTSSIQTQTASSAPVAREWTDDQIRLIKRARQTASKTMPMCQMSSRTMDMLFGDVGK